MVRICFPLLFFTSWRITVQLKFNVFYGPTSMKERCGALLLGLAKSIYYFYIGWKWLLWFYVHRDRSIGCYKSSIRVDYKSDLELFSPVTSSDEDITIFRGYYCKYQLVERPVRQGIICKPSSKRASQTSKQKHNRAKHFG